MPDRRRSLLVVLECKTPESVDECSGIPVTSSHLSGETEANHGNLQYDTGGSE